VDFIAFVQRRQPQLEQRFSPVRIVGRRLLVPLDRFVRVASRRFDFAQGEEQLFAGPLLRGLVQRTGRGAKITALHVGLTEADARFVAGGICLQQIVVRGQRTVVVLLV